MLIYDQSESLKHLSQKLSISTTQIFISYIYINFFVISNSHKCSCLNIERQFIDIKLSFLVTGSSFESAFGFSIHARSDTLLLLLLQEHKG